MTEQSPDNALMAMILRRCGLDERALPLLGAIESAAWCFIGEETELDTIRDALALVGCPPEDWQAARRTAPPALHDLLLALISARTGDVPADVIASFAADSLRTAILIEDAFRRGHQLALEHQTPRAPSRWVTAQRRPRPRSASAGRSAL